MGKTRLPLFALALACSTTLGCASLSQSNTSNGVFGGPAAAASSFTDKLASWFKPDKPKTPVGPAVNTSDTALSLSKKPKLGPDVNVAMAQMAESAGKIAEAEKQYAKALSLDPQFVPALLGLARLKDRAGQLEAATKYYQKAITANPQDARSFNDLGLCYHRRAMLKEASETLHKAVTLQPARKLYRNNLAAVLVDMNRPDDALQQLVAADGQAVGHYNLGFLLMKNGDKPAALAEFQSAAAADPSLDAAQQWIARLQNPPTGRMDMQVARKTTVPVYRNTPPSAQPAAGPAVGSTEPQDPPQQTSQLLQLRRPAPPAAEVADSPPAAAEAPTAAPNSPAAALDAPIAVMAAPEPLDATAVPPTDEEPAPTLTSQAAATPAVTSSATAYPQATAADAAPADAPPTAGTNQPSATPPATVLNASDASTGANIGATSAPVPSSPSPPDLSGPQLGPSARRTATALPRY